MSSGIHDIDIDTAAADALAAEFFERGGAPGLSYGIVADGTLVHSAGYGARLPDGTAPDEATVFRIASMSKSFTASAILLLRDAGALALDDPAEKYVPELASRPPVTIRHLLTMSAGFPTDDPWGDRQQGLSPEAFGEFLAAGVSRNWAPGTRFEYSNLGYAILGRVITAASGAEFAEFVRTRLLAPLGMTRTGYTAEEFGGVSAAAGSPAAPEPAHAANMAQGYRRGPAGWEPVPFEPYGAFAPMGGVYSTVRDLAVWVHGFASAFPPGSGEPGPDDGGHPLSAASRREMQLPQAVTGWRTPERLPGGGPGNPAYYGFGLFVDEEPGLGRVVGHSGGYPGFGTNMRWHPATGIGVIALGNGTYCGTSVLTGQILQAIVPKSPAYTVALAPAPSADSAANDSAANERAAEDTAGAGPAGGPWPETLRAREAVEALLTSSSETAWEDAAGLFSENVAWDAPFAERRHAVSLVRAAIGNFAGSATRPPESDTPAHCRWWLTGERGTVCAQIQLTPQRPPRVQSLTVAIPPAADSALAKALDAVVTWLNAAGTTSLADGVAVAANTDVSLMTRRLRMAAAWAGTVRTGAFRAGDGASTVTVELEGEHAAVTLTLSVNAAGELRAAEVVV